MAKEVNLNINKFLGLWYDNAGDTNIPVGALSQLQNFQVLPSYKLRKRSGYTSLLDQNFFEYLGTTLTIPAGRMVGDVDGNGKFTQADSTLLTDDDHYLKSVNESSPIDLKACDIDNNKQVTSSDLVIMISLMSNPYTVNTWARDLLGVWGTKYDLEVTTTDWTYYTDITVSGMTEGDDIPIVLEGFDDIGLLPTAERGAGYIRVFSKLLPATERTAYYNTTLLTASELTPALPVKGQWYGKINGNLMHIVAVGGKIYNIHGDYEPQELGDITDAKTHFFQFGDKLYALNGTDYIGFDGKPVIDPNAVSFDSSDYSGFYPKTVTLPAGKYRVEMAGGAGVSVSYFGQIVKGGEGGIIKFDVVLDTETSAVIKHITNGSETQRDSYWIELDGTLYAAVGAGGDAGYGHHSDIRYRYKGGDGGGETGEDGEGQYYSGGLGGTQVAGGDPGGATSVTNYNNAAGQGGKSYNDATNPGKGGIGSSLALHTDGSGGCGYCGGGGGGYVYHPTNPRQHYGAGGGGSSYVKPTGITLVQNKRGGNQSAGYIKIIPYQEYNTATSVEGYIPKTYVGTKPDGTNGTKLEPINTLTGKRRQLFNGDNAATKYVLAEKNNTSVDAVKVGGVTKTATTHYTVNATKDEVTFEAGSIPPEGIDNVEIAYKHDADTDRAEVVKYTHARLYGGKNDNRVFLFGNGNRIIYSDLADGVPSAEYFPVTNTMDVGNSQYDITDLSVQYDRMLIHKEKGTWWTQYDYDTTLAMANFPVYPLNDNIGSSYKGTAQICENNPFVLQDKRLWEFVASNVRDERNVKYLSERVQPLLDELDFTNVRTLDYERFGEYWIIVDNKAYIYNYRLGVWFYYYFADTITTAIVKEGRVVLGTTGGDLMEMDGALDDNGTLINAYAETGWLNYGYSNMQKFLNFMWVQIFPEYDTSAEIYFQTDRGEPRLVKEIFYKNFALDDVDFADLSFMTNYNPKSFRLKPKAKKFVYIKFTFINNKRNKLTLLGLAAPSLLGGQSK